MDVTEASTIAGEIVAQAAKSPRTATDGLYTFNTADAAGHVHTLRVTVIVEPYVEDELS